MKNQIHVQSYTIPLRSSFKHHSAERKTTATVLVTVERNGFKGYGESCPRSYVTGETVEKAINWIKEKSNDLSEIHSLQDLKNWNKKTSSEIDTNLRLTVPSNLPFWTFFQKKLNKALKVF